MSPFVPDIQNANRHEVLWSDIIEPTEAAADTHAARLARMLAAPGDDSPEAEVTADLRDELADRAQHLLLEASISAPSISASAVVGSAAAMPTQSMQIVGPQALASIPELECVSDFSRYLLESDIREEVIERFLAVARPLLESGVQVIVISHSWGTVVAYEALRRLDSDAGLAGSVATLFTVGSALSIPSVKRRLLPEAIDGARPAKVGRWVNLNARFDIIGGHLRANPFAVDYEYLNLEPVGCSALIPNPLCAHGSYFNKDNLAVNRDLFAFFIES
jgi:hypothetical protein